MTATVSGTVTVDAAPAERQLVAISHAEFERSGNKARHVVGAALSDAVTGDYTLTLDADYSGEVLIVALDDFGSLWAPNADYVVGDVIRPTAGNETGYRYICTADGNSGATEPAWWIDSGDNTTGSVGAATFAAHQAFRPQAHAPVAPVVTGGGPTVLTNDHPNLWGRPDFNNVTADVAADLSGNGNGMTLDTILPCDSWTGNAIVNHANSARPSMPMPNGLTALSISCWIRIDRLTASNQMVFNLTNDDSNGCFLVSRYSTGEVRYQARDSALVSTVNDVSAPLIRGKYHHIAMVWDGSAVVCYFDDVDVGSFELASFSDAANPFLTFTNHAASDYPILGEGGALRVFANYALTPDDVSLLASEFG